MPLLLRRSPSPGSGMASGPTACGFGSSAELGAMRTRQLIDGASFGPDVLKVIGEAFDQARAATEAHFGDDPLDIERARFRLATVVHDIRGKPRR